ncbi:MAG: DUF3047 domain-containing protein [Deltaproteobacteria bacterium]|nr:DUF3047 domain-containing protein [Deltaproteobacteria bacterium]
MSSHRLRLFILSLLFSALMVCLHLTGSATVVDRIPVTQFHSPNLQNGVPAGWELEKRNGTPVIRLEKISKVNLMHILPPLPLKKHAGDHYVLRMTSDAQSAFGIRRPVQVNLKEHPFLSWKWAVTKFPSGGDVRKKDRDDQALQIYIAFKSAGFTANLNTPLLGYIWDTEAPVGTTCRSTQTNGDKVRYIVMRNKINKAGRWYTEKRNVYQDYRTLFSDINRGEPPEIMGIVLYINSQRTQTGAEALIHDVFFSKG